MVETRRRREIEAVASELFRASGYAATSVRDIARALDIQGASLYAHVSSKEDLLWAIVDRAAARFEAIRAASRQAEGTSVADAASTLSALVVAHVRVITDDVGAASVLAHDWRYLNGARRAGIVERRDAYERRVRDLVTDGIATGEFAMTDPSLAAIAILSVLNAIPGWYDPAGRLPPDRIADHFVDLILRMLHGASG